MGLGLFPFFPGFLRSKFKTHASQVHPSSLDMKQIRHAGRRVSVPHVVHPLEAEGLGLKKHVSPSVAVDTARNPHCSAAIFVLCTS